MDASQETVPREQLCAIYTRISDDREGDELGVQRQEDDCRALAKQLGLTIYHIYSDNDIGASDQSSKRKVREDYLKMLAEARAGTFGRILAYSNSRITRRPRELEELIDLFKETEAKFGKGKGVIVNTVVSGNDDLSTADGRMTARLKAGVDAGEVERLAERLQRKNLQKAMRGEPAKQHRRPFGFEDDQVTHRTEEAAAIREAVQEIIGGASITAICRKWNQQGIKTTDGKEWKWTPLRRVLLGWRSAGVRVYQGQPLYDPDGQLVMGSWEPIISLEEREAAIAKLEERSRRGQREGKWLLQGLLQCGLCGRRLYGAMQDKTGKRPSSYTCTGSGTTHMGISAERVEHYIERVVLRYLLDKAIYGVPNEQPQEKKVWPQEARLRAVTDKIAELMAAYNRDELDRRLVFPEVQRLIKERDELERDRAAFRAEQLARPNRVATIEDAVGWFTGKLERSFEERQQSLREEIDFVVISKGTKAYGGNTPEVARQAAVEKRVSIVWKEPHYEYNGLTAEEAVETPFELPGHLLDRSLS
ncbi:resolvase [Microbacterium barkeri]|uniref:Resolvase n=1 Tax=Microbacterium barkeri TaxID=33917 RepID=A0A9W6LXA4_9MICO|nr:recombinase family protein [Microbacterium barkeri]MDI6944217.1 recombinase family protein [Microbacterium barkeri]MDR6876789.1 DNA invertase Pin-like site-specific DNA recombinase [Microbacterium barkeri]GLJ62231.1 resolvase [Microbacterium barkeri]